MDPRYKPSLRDSPHIRWYLNLETITLIRTLTQAYIRLYVDGQLVEEAHFPYLARLPEARDSIGVQGILGEKSHQKEGLTLTLTLTLTLGESSHKEGSVAVSWELGPCMLLDMSLDDDLVECLYLQGH